MKTLYIKELQKGLVFENETFAIVESSKSEDKNSKPYYNITLADKTGKIPAKIWSDNLSNINTKDLVAGHLVKISAKVDEFRGQLQLNIMTLERVNEDKMEEYIESSAYSADDMMDELFGYIDQIKDSSVKKLLKTIFKDEEFYKKYKYWPAGNSVHHGFRSGLLQHVLEMLNLAISLKKFYPEINYDVLIAGIILHDSGKTEELSGGFSSNYTKKGSLLGHIVIGVQILNKHGLKILDEDTRLHIEHLILSHHGRLEYGSPVAPSTPEAVALSNIDNLSSKLRSSLKILADTSDEEEFSRPAQWLENARLWKKHNLQINTADEDSIKLTKESGSESEGQNLDQISLIN